MNAIMLNIARARVTRVCAFFIHNCKNVLLNNTGPKNVIWPEKSLVYYMCT